MTAPLEKRTIALAEGRQLEDLAQMLEKELPRARQARPEDAVPRWLTGELLMLIGGEPEEILPHLQFALGRGLATPHLLGSLRFPPLGQLIGQPVQRRRCELPFRLSTEHFAYPAHVLAGTDSHAGA